MKKLKYILFMLLCLIPFTTVKAELSPSDIFDTTPKKGYRCYVLCQDPECHNKMTFYSNRDMSVVKTYQVEVTKEGNVNDFYDSNEGINLFANNIKYPDTNAGELHNIGYYFNRAVNGDFGETVSDEVNGTINGIIARKGQDGYEKILKEMLEYDGNSDISPYACAIAGEAIDIANNTGGQWESGGHYQFVYEEDSEGKEKKVFDLSFNNMDTWPNLDQFLFLEGSDFLIVIDDYTDRPFASFVDPEDENDETAVFHPPVLEAGSRIYDEKNGPYRSDMLNKDEREKLEAAQQCVDNPEKEGQITHAELMSCLKCKEAVNDDKTISYSNVCESGFTLGVFPIFEYSRTTQQDAIDSYDAGGIYHYNKAAFDLIASNVSMSCHDIRFATYIWRAICILAPFLFIIFGSLDFIKAIIANDEKKQKEATGKLPKRIIAFIILLILPIIIRLIFQFGQYNSGNLGLLKCVVTFDTTSTELISRTKAAGSGGSDYPTPKKKCEEYEASKCPNVDNYGHKCHAVPQEGTTSVLTCQRTGEMAKSCPQYGMTDCKGKDDYGKECTLIKKDGSSTPVCDYK